MKGLDIWIKQKVVEVLYGLLLMNWEKRVVVVSEVVMVVGQGINEIMI